MTMEIIWAPPQNGRNSLVDKDLPVHITRYEKKRNNARIIVEPSDGLRDKYNQFIEENTAGDRYLWFLGKDKWYLAMQVLIIVITTKFVPTDLHFEFFFLGLALKKQQFYSYFQSLNNYNIYVPNI